MSGCGQPPLRARIVVTGRVQGVAFRAHTRDEGVRLGLTGVVRNLADGGVEIIAEGENDVLQRLIAWAGRGPTSARVDSRQCEWLAATGEFTDFQIVY
jgi:acylphosphatase